MHYYLTLHLLTNRIRFLFRDYACYISQSASESRSTVVRKVISEGSICPRIRSQEQPASPQGKSNGQHNRDDPQPGLFDIDTEQHLCGSRSYDPQNKIQYRANRRQAKSLHQQYEKGCTQNNPCAQIKNCLFHSTSPCFLVLRFSAIVCFFQQMPKQKCFPNQAECD